MFLESVFLERSFEVDHSTVNRWILAYAPRNEKRLRQFRRPHSRSIRVDETYVKIRGTWRYIHRAIDKHGVPVDLSLTAKRNLDAAKRFVRKALKDEPLLGPQKIGTDGAKIYPTAIFDSAEAGLMPGKPMHRVSKHLQQGLESDHFHVKKNMPKIGAFQSFASAKRTVAGFEAMLWLKKGCGFASERTVRTQNELLVCCFGLRMVDKT